MRTLMFVLLSTASAAAHDAPSGWSYGFRMLLFNGLF